jgi:hypothetical protein
VNVAPPRLKAIPAPVQEQVHDQERGALVPVRESVISRQRFHERGGLSVDRAIVAGERPSDCGFKQAPIANSGQAAKAKRLFVRFNDVLDSDPIAPYGGSALGQPLE